MQRLGDPSGRRFEPIKWGVPASGEFALIGLAEEILNSLLSAVVAAPALRRTQCGARVTNQGTIVPEAQRSGMHGRVRVQEEFTIGVGTGVPPGVYCFSAAAGALALGIGGYGFRIGWCPIRFWAERTVVRGPRAQRLRRTVLGRLRGGSRSSKVAPLDQQGQEEQG